MKELGVLTRKNYGANALLVLSSNTLSYAQKLNETISVYTSYEVRKIYDVDDDFSFNEFIDMLNELFPNKHSSQPGFSIEPESMIQFLNSLSDVSGLVRRRDKTNSETENEEETNEEEEIIYDEKTEGNTGDELFESPGHLTKKDCADILGENGFHINETLTLSSLNKNGKYYWSNAPIEYLSEDWSLMLNDTENHIIYLFEIKAHTIDPSKMTLRKGEGREHCMQLEFVYLNDDFLECVSGVKFKPYLVGQVHYGPANVKKNETKVETREHKAGVVTAPLSQIDVSNIPSEAEILSFEFQGKTHKVQDNKEMIDFIFNYLYQEDPSLFRKSAHSNSLSKYFYFGTPGDDDIDLYYKVAEADIYYKKEIVDGEIKKGVLAVKRFFDKTKFNKPLSSLVITIDYGDDDDYIDWDLIAELDW